MTFRSIDPKTLLVLSALFMAAPGASLKASRHGPLATGDLDIAKVKREMGCPPGMSLADYVKQIEMLMEPYPQAKLDLLNEVLNHTPTMVGVPSGDKTTKQDKE